jgi:hypothetical protein
VATGELPGLLVQLDRALGLAGLPGPAPEVERLQACMEGSPICTAMPSASAEYRTARS